MEQNQLYLIKDLEKKINDLKKVISDPDGYNSGLASEERVGKLEVLVNEIKEFEKRIDGQGYLLKQLLNKKERVEDIEERLTTLEKRLEEVLDK